MRPAAVLGQVVVHRLGDGVAVGVVRRHERGLLVLAECLQQHRADRRGRGLAIEVLAEAVAHAVLAGGVVRAGDAGDVEHLLALRELVECDGDRLEVEPVISMVLFSLMKRLDCSCTAWFGLAAKSATRRFTFLPSTPLVVLGEIFLISGSPLLMCSTASC